jgi:hypothetical protein
MDDSWINVELLRLANKQGGGGQSAARSTISISKRIFTETQPRLAGAEGAH